MVCLFSCVRGWNQETVDHKNAESIDFYPLVANDEDKNIITMKRWVFRTKLFVIPFDLYPNPNQCFQFGHR